MPSHSVWPLNPHPTTVAAMPGPDPTTRVVFANQLRGLAAISVVASHFLGIFFLYPQGAAALLQVPPLQGNLHPWLSLALGFLPGFGLGPFGVALFFLISGFVIPISLERQGPARFLIARFFRIWPTYAAGLLISVLVLVALHKILGLEFSISPVVVLVNAAIVIRDWLQWPGIDGLVWTLEIETKFYLLMVVLAVLLGRVTATSLLGVSFIFALANVVCGALHAQLLAFIPAAYGFCYVLTFNMMIAVYMLIGTIFYFAHRGRIGPLTAALSGLALYALVGLSWWTGLVGVDHARANFPSYGWALGVFGLAYVWRRRFKSSRVLDYFAMISYSLYVSHAVLGYGLLYIFTKYSLPGPLAVFVTTVVALCVATLLHVAIERPTQDLGKAIARSQGVALLNSKLASKAIQFG